MPSRGGYFTAAEAARNLGITRATLYAYVSRGLIRSERGQGRARRYHASDVAALRHGGESAVKPDIETSITLALDGRLYYRGRDAAILARDLSVREAAALIWQADPVACFAAGNLPAPLENQSLLLEALAELPPAARAQAMLQAAIPAQKPGAFRDAESLGREGAKLLRFLVACVAGVVPSSRPVEAVLAEAWGLESARRPLLRSCLILSADCGIDAASQAARLACATGGHPWRAVSCGLAALDKGGVNSAAEPLFTGSDPRGLLLVEMLGGKAESPALEAALDLIEAKLRLPPGASEALQLLGRSIGLVAHIGEEASAPRHPRPRGCYVGFPPENP
jgi:citrate synthase